MLLVIDVGNTNIVMGVYDGSQLTAHWRVRTERDTTEDEFNVLAAGLFTRSKLDFKQIQKTAISSVVPPMVNILDAFVRKYLGHAPLWVDAKSFPGMPILYSNPNEVGADRIVNAVAAFQRYQCELIVIDFGTATTFDVITQKGEYLGGAITPGIGISAEALFARASKLPRVEIFKPPASVIGKDTIGSMQSGIIVGYACLVDGMVQRIRAERQAHSKVIATGGLAPLIQNVSTTIEAVEPDLTLEGLKIIADSL
jgi:type III pantothenate kinase